MSSVGYPPAARTDTGLSSRGSDGRGRRMRGGEEGGEACMLGLRGLNAGRSREREGRRMGESSAIAGGSWPRLCGEVRNRAFRGQVMGLTPCLSVSTGLAIVELKSWPGVLEIRRTSAPPFAGLPLSTFRSGSLDDDASLEVGFGAVGVEITVLSTSSSLKPR